jgi:hypothetical protein
MIAVYKTIFVTVRLHFGAKDLECSNRWLSPALYLSLTGRCQGASGARECGDYCLSPAPPCKSQVDGAVSTGEYLDHEECVQSFKGRFWRFFREIMAALDGFPAHIVCPVAPNG